MAGISLDALKRTGQWPYDDREFRSRVEGYQRRRKVWTCRACRAWHEEPKKPPACEQCGHTGKDWALHYGSAGEGRRFVKLMRELDHGLISELSHHPTFSLLAYTAQGPVKAARYEADSCYRRLTCFVEDGVQHEQELLVIEDYKPRAAAGLDPVFKLKRKWFEAQYAPWKITLIKE